MATTAKSGGTTRANSSTAKPRAGEVGTSTSVTISSGASAVVSGPVTKSRAAMLRRPEADATVSRASSVDSVPLPPPGAQRFDTVCQFCIVGCGYKVFKWPVGRDGSPEAQGNALGVDYTRPLPPLGEWISTAMHSVVTDKDARRYNVVIVPDKGCVVNEGLASVRGGGLAQTLFAPDRATKARLSQPLVAQGRGHAPIGWDAAVDLGARVIKAVVDRWGPDAVGMKFFDHGGGGGGFEANWAVGRFFFSGVSLRTIQAMIQPPMPPQMIPTNADPIAGRTTVFGRACEKPK